MSREETFFENLYKSVSPEDFMQLEEMAPASSSRKAWHVAAMRAYQLGRASGQEDAALPLREMNDYLDGYNAGIEYAKEHPEICAKSKKVIEEIIPSMLDSKGNTVHVGDFVSFHIGIKASGKAYVDEIYIDSAGTPRVRLRGNRYQLASEDITLVSVTKAVAV